MKKGFKLLCVMAIIFMTTGCVKIDINMDINKDKSMNLTLLEAVDEKLLQGSGETAFDEDQIKELEKEGYKVQKYNKDGMIGVNLTKKINNIDKISTTDSITGNLSIYAESNQNEDNYLFTIEKGLFKNKYIANLNASDASTITDQAEGLNSNNETNEETTIENTENDMALDILDEQFNTEEEIDEEFSQNTDLEQLIDTGMKMNFTVNLPYKALNNNADKIDNHGKTLTWDLLTNENQNIEFEFELYNMTNIYIAIGLGIILLILIIILIIKKIKNNKNGKDIEEITIGTKLNEMNSVDLSNMQSQPNAVNIPGSSRKATKNIIEETTNQNQTPENKENEIEILDLNNNE